MKWAFSCLLFFYVVNLCSAQETEFSPDSYTISWKGNIPSGCEYTQLNGNSLPVKFLRFETTAFSKQLKILNEIWTDCEQDPQLLKSVETFSSNLKQYITSESGKLYLNVEVPVFRSNTQSGNLQKLVSFKLAESNAAFSNPFNKALGKKSEFAANSVLSNGDWYKFRVINEGVFRITASQLKDIGLDLANIDISSFQVFGTEGGPLPEIIDDSRTDDLKELAVQIIDANGNGKLDGSEQIMFYAEGPHVWRYNSSLKMDTHEFNYFDNQNFIFLTHSQQKGKRIQQNSSGEGTAYDSTYVSFLARTFHETDEYQGSLSGRIWLGESFLNQNDRSFKQTFPNALIDSKGTIRYRVACRSIIASSGMRVQMNGTTLENIGFSPVSGDFEENFMDLRPNTVKTFNIAGSEYNLDFTFFPGNSTANAWVDYFEISVPSELKFSSGSGFQSVQLYKTESYNRIKLRFNELATEFWDVTDYFNSAVCSTFDDSGKPSFITSTSGLRKKFISFTGSSIGTPEYAGKVSNQNLHALRDIEYAIISPKSFLDQANKLATFHTQHYNYKVSVIELEDIYNEFSGGVEDVTAIRDFLRMLYVNGKTGSVPLRFALLFGDGSYDYKDRLSYNTNFIPTFQSRESNNPSYSYASDDYFAILESGEGYFDVTGAQEGLDIGIGRIPCRTQEQANIALNKVTHYHEKPALGEWRNNVTFLGDDEDNNTHFRDSENVSKKIDNQAPVFNIKKIYLDAYEEQSYGSGQKYPEVNDEIDHSFDRGQLIFNYLGHGGSSGMAHERVVTREQIRAWSNYDKLPVVITATCELSRYDDPSQDSPGELMLFDDDGGAIALITTTRIVFIGNNYNLNDKIIDNNMFNISSVRPTLGEIMMKGKNNSLRAVNQRNFTLLGDPGVVMAYPKYNVVTTAINDSVIGIQAMDTFKAFSKMKIDGEIRDHNNQLIPDFNGVVFPTVFDKYVKYLTLGNDPESKVDSFFMQNSVLYRGQVSVQNGKFSFQFVVPKDIAYQFGNGKISYYAMNENLDDANGYEKDIKVGGSISDIATDTTGPSIDLFMDDFSFVFGGITGTKPILLCKLFDENGINTVGNGIGRDITAILDEGTEQEKIIVLNDYYQATLDSYQEGLIRYPMEALSNGRHTIRVRVWDVYNNTAEDYTEFIVATDENLKIDHILNYPNPFTTATTFHFDHNRAGMNLDVLIQVMTVSGKVVKTLESMNNNGDSHFSAIDWDGRDDFGDKLARGVYIYKVTVRSEDGKKTSEIQKLVLL
ncbi:MAG: type IX secretion system sortase PorU [Bacteroidetes bacterium]|nr:type IX secretion system sortase PorU [Bacteroidota bacterium]